MAIDFNRSKFASAYSAAPVAVREAMGSKVTAGTIAQLQATYNLHVDVVGNISKAIGYMLLGLIDPKTFYTFLTEQSISAENATAITQEINTQIFLPLQKLIREGGKANEPAPNDDEPEAEYDSALENNISTEYSIPAPQSTQSAPQIPVMQIAPTVQLTPPPVLPTLAPAAPIQPSTETPAYNLVRPDVLVAAPRPVMLHSMQADIEALKNPTVPQTLAPVSTPAMLHPEHLTPARSFQTGSVPFGGATPQPRFQPKQGPTIAPSGISPSREVPPPTSPIPAQPEIVKEYSADPYREPM